MKIIKTLVPVNIPTEDYYEVFRSEREDIEIFTVEEFEESLRFHSIDSLKRYKVKFYDTEGNVYEVTFEEEQPQSSHS